MDVIVLIIVSVLNLFLGIFVIRNNPHNKINISFSLSVLGLSLWVGAWAAAFWVADEGSKLFWTRMMLAGPSIDKTL